MANKRVNSYWQTVCRKLLVHDSRSMNQTDLWKTHPIAWICQQRLRISLAISNFLPGITNRVPWSHRIQLISHASIQNSTINQGVAPSEISETKNNTTMGYLYHILSFYGFWTFLKFNWCLVTQIQYFYTYLVILITLLSWNTFWPIQKLCKLWINGTFIKKSRPKWPIWPDLATLMLMTDVEESPVRESLDHSSWTYDCYCLTAAELSRIWWVHGII